ERSEGIKTPRVFTVSWNVLLGVCFHFTFQGLIPFCLFLFALQQIVQIPSLGWNVIRMPVYDEGLAAVAACEDALCRRCKRTAKVCASSTHPTPHGYNP
ncbi:MAG: hypothetical protein KAI43_10615, partial [Candidatus Aureabacteria bacterium]|nr:hypothetical protein [Candidatus Auribacterota bacterium]